MFNIVNLLLNTSSLILQDIYESYNSMNSNRMGPNIILPQYLISDQNERDTLFCLILGVLILHMIIRDEDMMIEELHGNFQ